MKVNEASWDRIARVLLGAGMMAAGFGGFVSGTAGLVLGLIGLVPLVTGLIGFCPLYGLLGLSTCPVKPTDG